MTKHVIYTIPYLKSTLKNCRESIAIGEKTVLITNSKESQLALEGLKKIEKRLLKEIKLKEKNE